MGNHKIFKWHNEWTELGKVMCVSVTSSIPLNVFFVLFFEVAFSWDLKSILGQNTTLYGSKYGCLIRHILQP